MRLVLSLLAMIIVSVLVPVYMVGYAAVVGFLEAVYSLGFPVAGYVLLPLLPLLFVLPAVAASRPAARGSWYFLVPVAAPLLFSYPLLYYFLPGSKELATGLGLAGSLALVLASAYSALKCCCRDATRILAAGFSVAWLFAVSPLGWCTAMLAGGWRGDVDPLAVALLSSTPSWTSITIMLHSYTRRLRASRGGREGWFLPAMTASIIVHATLLSSTFAPPAQKVPAAPVALAAAAAPAAVTIAWITHVPRNQESHEPPHRGWRQEG
ncbi:MAG: hypothetical protein DSY37_02385 [Hyperthermus sp.]|nr:MAG: hypothetical protein DSY37_02385 [Hyperthermus sp.]